MTTQSHWTKSVAATLGLLALAHTAWASPRSNTASGLSVYEGPRFRGEKVFIGGSARDLKDLDFDNRISSVRIIGGEWELCAEPNFRGRCVRVTGEIVSLAGTGLDNKVSSIRRVDVIAPPP